MTQPRKPDAFEKMVHNAVHGDAVLTQIETVQLLRAYHRQVVRMVKRQQGWERDGFCNMTTQPNAMWMDRCALLDALDQLKKGTQP